MSESLFRQEPEVFTLVGSTFESVVKDPSKEPERPFPFTQNMPIRG